MKNSTENQIIRKIQDIDAILPYYFMDYELDIKTYGKYKKFIADNEQRLGLYCKYIGRLHDSWFIKTEITSNKFSFTLNDFTTHVFSDVIVQRNKLDIDHKKLVFPLRLDLEIISLTFNKVKEDGEIQIIKPTKIDEYLYEQIISIHNDILEIGLVVLSRGVKNKQGKQILILIKVKNLILTELQDNAWREIFGNKYDKLYQYFKNQFETGRYLSDQSKCNELVDEYYKLFN